MIVIWLILATIAAWILYHLVKRSYIFCRFYRKINRIPGPNFGIPFYGTIYKLMTIKKEDRINWFGNMFNEYKGGIIRLWMGFNASVTIRKPEHIELILRSTTQIGKGKAYEYVMPWLGRGLLTSTGPPWHHSRKLITPTFHFSILKEFSEVMIEKADILNECIEKAMKKNGDKPFDIFGLALKCALDIICETSMGVNVHAQEEIESDYIKSVQAIAHGVIYRMFRPWLKVDWIYNRSSAGKTFKRAVDTSHELCTQVITRKQLERKLAAMGNNKAEENATDEFGQRKRKAFLDLLLEANEKTENPMSIEEIRDQANTFLFAGHDTTGALISWTIFCLGIELDVQRKVHEELDEVLGDLDDQDSLKQMSNLKYLDRVIKETLRLYPSAPNISRSLSEDMQIGDHIVPVGATLEIHIYELHRDASVWPDPLRFDPDRFLPENSQGRSPYAYLPFSAGLRNCIGQKYAILEAKVVLAHVLRKFSVKSVENHETIKKHSEIILRPVDGIYVHMKKRS